MWDRMVLNLFANEEDIPDLDDIDEDDEENLYYEPPDRCDYCGEYSYICGTPFSCSNPHGEEIKYGAMYYKDNICGSCCEERIEEGDGECFGCKIFEKKFPLVRYQKVEEEFKDIGLEFVKVGEKTFKSEDPKWEYHLLELPETIDKDNLIKADLLDFKILLRRYEDTVIIFKDNTFGVHLDSIDRFKRRPVQLDKIFVNEKPFEKNGKPFIMKDLILKFIDIEFGDYMPEYAILPMIVFKDDYDYSDAEYILDQNKIKITKFEDKTESLGQLRSLNIFLAQMKISPDDFDEEGSFKEENRPRIESMVQENLQLAKTENANLIFFPEYSIPRTLIDLLREFSKESKVWIIGGVERTNYESQDHSLNTQKWLNTVFIFGPNKSTNQAKIKPGKDEPELYPGTDLIICESDYGTFAILNCADFLDDDLLLRLKKRLDFLLVPSLNKDIDSFSSQAKIACVKNSCYIIINNSSLYGGCSIFGPLHGNKHIFEVSEGTVHHYEVDLNDFHLHRTGEKPDNENFKAVLKDTNFAQQIR